MTINYALVFPGQGSQHLGMLSSFSKKYNIVKKTFDEASIVLGYDLWDLIQYGPIDRLNTTQYTQPALLAVSIAIWRILIQTKIFMPTLLTGHSLGEYTALVCANSIDFITAIKLVELRGKLMQEVIQDNIYAMSVIVGLDHNSVISACLKKSKKKVYPVIFNSPEQVVIAGYKTEVENTMIFCKQLGAKYTKLLPISVLSHCNFIKPVIKKFIPILNSISFKKPMISIVNNVDIRVEKDPKMIKRALIRQIYNPIYWTKIVKYFVSCKIKMVLEIGPGKVLTQLTKNNVNNISCIAVNNLSSLIEVIKKIHKD